MFVINTTKVLHRDTGLCMTASNIITGETFLQIPFKGVQSVYQYLQELEEYISSPLRIAADFNIYSQRAFQIYYSGRADGAPVKQWINARKLLPANRVIYGIDQACELRLHRDGCLFDFQNLFHFLTDYTNITDLAGFKRINRYPRRKRRLCGVCGKHRPSSWRYCLCCQRWVGLGCSPEKCWQGDQLHRCINCALRIHVNQDLFFRETTVHQ